MSAMLAYALLVCSAIVHDLRAIVGIVSGEEKFYGRNCHPGTI